MVLVMNNGKKWRPGVAVITAAQLQLILNLGSAQVQTLLAACRRFAVVRTSDNGPVWTNRLSVNHTTKIIHHLHHHQFDKYF